MNSTAAIKKLAGTLSNWKHSILLVVLAMVVCVFVIEPQSFWIDEANTAFQASQPTLTAWRKSLLDGMGSDTQMPAFMFYVWGWEKVFGHGEWWSRLSNLPWLMLSLLAIPRRQKAFLLVLLISPFIWYYLDEFRPYLMQISTAMLMFGSLWRLMELPENQAGIAREKYLTAIYCIGLVLLSGSSLLGMIWGGALLGMTAMILGWRRTIRLAWRNLISIVPSAILLSLLAVYYLWTIKHGNAATEGKTNIESTGFIFYEMAGFAGLGPGRNQLHSEGIAPLRPYIPLLMFQAVITVCVLIAGGKYIIRNIPRRIWLWVASILGGMVFLLLALGMLKNFRVLGRHLSPLEPALLLVLAYGICELWSRGRFWRALTVIFILLNLASALELRFASRHAKDDYRDAAAVAIAANAQDKQVWWCADGNSGLFYGVPLSPLHQLSVPGQVWTAIDKPIGTLRLLITNEPPPKLIVISKPEIYDQQGLILAYVKDHHFLLSQSFPSFAIWKK